MEESYLPVVLLETLRELFKAWFYESTNVRRAN